MTETNVKANDLEFLSNDPLDGNPLTARLAEEALPPEEALRIALDVGLALHKAHASGRIHGRVCPAAVVITATGARLLQPECVEEQVAAPYRSPEQVREEPADPRSDIFSYGSLLYELVSRRRPFPGSVDEMDQAILERPAAALNAKGPIHAAMEGVIAGCMQKNPAARRQRIQNAVTDLKLSGGAAARTGILSSGLAQYRSRTFRTAVVETERTRTAPDTIRPVFRPPQQTPVRSRNLAIAILAGLAGIILTAVAVAFFLHRAAPAMPVLRLTTPAPRPAGYCSVPSLSPDGNLLACAAPDQNGQTVLWMRSLSGTTWSAIDDSDGAFAPFWSPDSRYVGFFAKGLLKRVAVVQDGVKTKTESLFEIKGNGGGGAWNSDGKILFAPGQEGGLSIVTAAGGKSQQVLQPRKDHHETAYLWPQFLPDGKHFIFYVQTDMPETSGVAVGALGSPSWQFLFESDTNGTYSSPAQSKTGYLLYIQDRNLRARSFNPSNFEIGESTHVEDEIGLVKSLSLAPISVSNTGMLVYEKMDEPTRQLQWMDRSGRLIRTSGDPAKWGLLRISPDGHQAILSRQAADGQHSDLWLVNDEGAASLFISTPGVSEVKPIWSPDGTRIAYASNRNGVYDIYSKPVNGGKEELMFRSPEIKYPTDWTADGNYILFGAIGEGTGSDVWALNVKDHKAGPIVKTIHAEGYAVVSPDGKWMAYESDETGRNEIYVQPFEPGSSETKRRVRVSPEGGDVPFWTRGGAELVYMTDFGHIMATSVHINDGNFSSETPQLLFQVRPMPPFTNLYDVSHDGSKFLINAPLERTRVAPVAENDDITVVTNWTQLKLK